MDDLILFYPENHQLHASPDHPERPERLFAIRQKLQEAGLWDSSVMAGPLEPTRSLLEAVHSPSHLTSLQEASQRGGRIDADTYVTADSWQLALQSAGGGLAVSEAVYKREVKSGFALCRPPGHHARPDQAMGFCLLNNAALAAENLIQNHGARKIAILDIDLHHGNGTQEIFFERDDVFFCSIHQYPLYPMTGLADEVGIGRGEGTNLNFPFPPYAGDEARMTALKEVILPLLEKFSPEMVLVSAGFDAHWRDPLGHQLATAKGYGEIASTLLDFAGKHCGGRLAFLLEGGYDLEGGASSAKAVVQALLGLPVEDELGVSPIPEDEYWQSRLRNVTDIWGL